jgi:AcrR family transcriptional regulator
MSVREAIARRTRAEPEGAHDKLLQAAEGLFAAHGYNGVSVRELAAAAGVNSALVSYHFGSKEGLLSEVYRRHCEKMNAERQRLLAAAQAKSRPARLEAVLEAFIRPALEVAGGAEGESFTRLRAVLSGENSDLLNKLVAENFDRSSALFIDALCECLPQLPREQAYWRFHFLLGTIYYTAAGPHRIRALSNGHCDPSDSEAAMRALIPFLAAGLKAPSAKA